MATNCADPKELLLAIEKIFKIAETRKKVEVDMAKSAGLDPETTAEIRRRIKTIVDAYNEAIKQFVHDEQTRALILGFVKRVLAGGGQSDL